MSVNRRTFLKRGSLAAGAFAALSSQRFVSATTEPDEEGETEAPATPIVSQSGADLSGQELNLYSSRHYDTDQEFYDDFTALSGVKINLIEAEADELIERI